MDLLANLKASPTIKINEKIYGADLLSAFDYYADKIKVLSLDCFDTLLWRKTASPVDVFYNLQHTPAFRSLGFNALMRYRSEADARTRKFYQQGINEVTLREIYTSFFPDLTEDQLLALEEAEIKTEISMCYAFPPVLELIRKAKSRGLKIIIVSDTYLKQVQLKQLLTHTLPSDVMSAIDVIFCSSEFGKSKVNGIFKDVLDHLKIAPEHILHIGDNLSADFMAPKQMRVNTLHLLHHDSTIETILRMQTTAASLMDPSIRYSRALTSPFRGLLSGTAIASDKPEQLIGYATLGPVLFSFAKFICDEIEQLEKAEKKPKVLFLMRDGYLPLRACEALKGKPLGKPIRISRFASFAASFRSEKEIDRYLGEMIKSNRFEDMCRQLLLPENIYAPLVQETLRSANPGFQFVQLIHQPKILDIILKKSGEYRKRLLSHIQNEIDLKAGDTLVFVDLGYSGTAQRLLGPILEEKLHIKVVGLYLISLSVPGWNTERKGLLDPSWCDDRMMITLITYIALLEQMCTSNEKSVIDYDEKGHPIFAETGIGEQQHHNLDLVQTECLRFIKDAAQFFRASTATLTLDLLQDAAMSNISRLLFLPSENEIRYFEKFHFELNLGTNDTFALLDQKKGLTSLRKRGLFSLFMEKNDKSMRTNAPAELRAAGVELVLSLMAQHRFYLDFAQTDLSLRKEKLEAIVMRGADVTQVSLDASLTHDGYFSLCVPVGTGNLQVGILFGKKYQWIQFESAELILTAAYLSELEANYAEDAWDNLIFDKMEDRGGKLFECISTSSFMMLMPKPKDENKYLFRIVFRPIVERDDSKQP